MKNRGDVFGLEPSQSAPVGRIQLPQRGSFFAITKKYRMNNKSLWQYYKLPLRGKTSPGRGKMSRSDKRGNLASRSDD